MRVEPTVICLAYMSSAREAPDASALEAILAVSRRNNAQRGVTGMLCHYDGSYLQFLEGEAEAVNRTFGVIAADQRHHAILEVFRAPIVARMFPDWTMSLTHPEKLGPEHRAFCHSLQRLELEAGPEHRDDLEPFLQSFRAWMR